MAGAWGFGTMAATDLIASGDFLNHPVVRRRDPFEATFTCRIEDDRIGEVTLGSVRRLR